MTAATPVTRRRLTLRSRLALLCAAAVAVAIAGVSAVTWVVTSAALRAQIDVSLQVPAAAPGQLPPVLTPLGSEGPTLAQMLCQEAVSAPDVLPVIGSWQLLSADGAECGRSDFGTVTPTPDDLAVAAGASDSQLRTAVTSSGTTVRVRTVALQDGYAIMIARDLSDVSATLQRLALVLAVVTALGSLGALLTGWLIARASLRPLDDLTATAEHIATTEDLDVAIAASGGDEIARLATAFNKMTSALSASRVRQQQLIADASHELRTPLTSLRTNIELLALADATGRALPTRDRSALLASVVAQTEELTELVSELTVLAHDEPGDEPRPVDLVDVVERAVARAQRRGHHRISTDLRPWTLTGDAAALERAVLNLLDNAVKFSPATSTVRVTLRHGVLDVDDAGPGIPLEHRSNALERFWRAPDARALPGSGLGLAIVADAASRHGGSVEILDSPWGGTRVRLRLPQAGPADDIVAGDPL